MTAPIPDSVIPTERELEALKILWRLGEATVRQVYEAMNAEGSGLAYTTVLSLLQVMEQKGLVNHVRKGKAYVYRTLVERRKTFRSLAGGFLEKVFDGAVDEYLVHVLEGRRLSAGALDELEAMITAARAKQSASRKKKANRSRRNRKRGDAS